MADPGEDTKVSFTVRLAQAANEDVKVKISIDPTLLDAYNQANQTEFVHVESEYLECPAYAVIPAGAVSTEPLTITVKSFPVYAQYAVAFRIESTGSIPVTEQSSKFVVQIKKPLKQMVPTFNNRCAMQCEPTTAWGLELMNYTLEWWVKMSNLNINNQAIINSGGGSDSNHTELYIRFDKEICPDDRLAVSAAEERWREEDKTGGVAWVSGAHARGVAFVARLSYEDDYVRRF
jgi:hypothetical protein